MKREITQAADAIGRDRIGSNNADKPNQLAMNGLLNSIKGFQ